MEVFIARQPIFTKSKKLFGYELLFRSGIDNHFPDMDEDVATASILSNLFFPFDVNQILGNKKGFINFTRQLILDKAPLYLPREKFIIEVLENIEPEKEILLALTLLKEKGYKIALDDFVYHEKFDPMIQLSKIIKFDLRISPLVTLPEIVDKLRGHDGLKFLAEKVETYDEFNTAKQMGFDYFQGYFFAKPEVISTKGLSTNYITKLKLLNEISSRELNIIRIQTYIKNDAPLSFRLLKYSNSVFFNRRIPIDTVKDAMHYIGEDELRRFINVVVLSDLGRSKPNELIRFSIIRAKMCERFKTIFKSKFSADELFTLGLFSCMDALMDCSMEDVLGHLAFSEKMKLALLGKDREFARMLDIIMGFEKGDWDRPIFGALAGSHIEKQLPGLYSEAIKMANAFY